MVSVTYHKSFMNLGAVLPGLKIFQVSQSFLNSEKPQLACSPLSDLRAPRSRAFFHRASACVRARQRAPPPLHRASAKATRLLLCACAAHALVQARAPLGEEGAGLRAHR